MPDRRRRPIIAVVAGGSILLGHSVAPEGTWYNNHLLEGSVVCALMWEVVVVVAVVCQGI